MRQAGRDQEQDDIMRILVLGAGGIGGYFGGRLTAAGVDVTFLVRDKRAALLARDGLRIRSELGDLDIPVKTITRETARPGYDAVLLSCKAYDLDDAIASLRPAAEGAMIVPLLNGMRHLDALDAAFGAEAVCGGVAAIGVTLEDDGTVRHFGKMQGYVHGARLPNQAARCAALAEAMAPGGFAPRNSDTIMQDMWEKFVLICTAAGSACLMRGGLATIAKTTYGAELVMEFYDECASVAAAAGHPPRPRHVEMFKAGLTGGSPANVPSMLRDLRRGFRLEADHIVGDMLARAMALGRPSPLLRAAFCHLQVYEETRAGG
jgi:2-dehydropantoate 2-reductase